MKAQKIGLWGAERIKAARAFHPFASYFVELQGRTLYLTKRQYARLKPVFEIYERHLAESTSQLAALDGFYEACDSERERAIDGWYEGQKENAALRDKIAELDGHNRILRSDNLRLMSNEGGLKKELSRARQQADESDIIASQNGNNPFYFMKEMGPQERRGAAKFLKSCIPKSRKKAARIVGIGHDYPSDFRKKLEALQPQRYIVRVHWVQRPPAAVKNGKVTCVQEGEHYTIVVPYFSDSFGADIKAETIARTPMEAEYLKHCIQELLQ